MVTYQQADRPLTIETPIGEDVLLITGFRGQEAISRPFRFKLELIAQAQRKIPFEDILGQSATIAMRLADGEQRYFNGIVSRFSQGARDHEFAHFKAHLVPRLWLLSKKVRSRIFQHVTVPEILQQVLTGLDVAYEVQGTYYPRNYCVQYCESDFDFMSRLMEDEGIYYYFKHSAGGHQMVVTDVTLQHPAVPGQSDLVYDEQSGGVRDDMRVTGWKKTQKLCCSEYTAWDHCFELPGKHLEAGARTIGAVTVGKVNHKLGGAADSLEIYEHPGGYAKRFDSVDHNGGVRPEELLHIFEDCQRTVRLRIEEEEAGAVKMRGASNCGNLAPGHRFTLERHSDADGRYLVTSVEHDARTGDYHSGQGLEFSYGNNFTCIPAALPFRPRRVTRKPVIAGVQTATVVGPPGEELFCDKYGRVKVQFHWDREGKKNNDSSCWLRVAQVSAGKGWGAFFWPRIGHEVVVAFEEGNPDQPVIVGSVYNAENMPPFDLPALNKFSGFKSSSVRGNAHEHFNGIVFIDEKDHEHLAIQ